MFDHITAYAGDPILSLNEEFHRDERTEKVNLSIGIYFDGDGKSPLMRAVSAAEQQVASSAGTRHYLPMSGTPDYRKAIQELVFGKDSAVVAGGKVATVQTLGGSGALKVGSDFLKRYFPKSEVWISNPSWENHRVIFEGSGFRVNMYPYYDAESGGLDFDGMLRQLQELPRESIVLLHACCHNPTGVDLTQDQWLQLVPVFQERGLIAFIDMAYQGFGDGLEEDAFGVRTFAEIGIPSFVANSFSKNFSLYGERCGGLSVVCSSLDEAQRVLGQITCTIRANYSNPPTHGARIVTQILTSPVLRSMWEAELAAMRERIHAMRRAIAGGLEGKVSEKLRQRYVSQRGMFTYTGLSPDQVDVLRNDYGVYILKSGRMCVAGLNEANVRTVVAAVAGAVGGTA